MSAGKGFDPRTDLPPEKFEEWAAGHGVTPEEAMLELEEADRIEAAQERLPKQPTPDKFKHPSQF